jgi:hypothetical protein
MSFSKSAQTKHEAHRAFWGARLIGVKDDAWVEQRRGLEAVLLQKVGADELTLDGRKGRMHRQRGLHFFSTRLEGFEQVAVALVEIFQHIRKPRRRGIRIEGEHASNNILHTSEVGRVDVTRLDGRSERTYDNARSVWAQLQAQSDQAGC